MIDCDKDWKNKINYNLIVIEKNILEKQIM